MTVFKIVADGAACYPVNKKTPQTGSCDSSFETVTHSMTAAAAMSYIQMAPTNQGWRSISFGAPGVNFYLRLGAIGEILMT